ncbi:calnexin [Vigna unguiculata]|uniref:Calnexin n=1 Tax=Vigna unguiculata TaxID=3917 RepID=A0A4D6L963_VIGUN|nr:calnexin [Vigna unguiculata]
MGIEIWTMQDGILFDNILIAKDDKNAESYRETTWKPKFSVEKEQQKAEDAEAGSNGLAGFQKKVFDLLYKIADIPFLSAYKPKIHDLIEKGEEQPNLTVGILVAILVVFVSIFFRIIFGGKKQPTRVEKTNVELSESGSNEKNGENEENKEKEESSAPPRRRSTRRED